MFPAVTVARNVARRGVFSHFCLCVQVPLSLATFSHGLSRSAVTEARRRATVCHGSTFHPGLPRSVGTSRVLLRCDQVLLRLSSYKMWAMMVFEPQYAHGIKRRSTKLQQIVILCTLDQKHHYM